MIVYIEFRENVLLYGHLNLQGISRGKEMRLYYLENFSSSSGSRLKMFSVRAMTDIHLHDTTCYKITLG